MEPFFIVVQISASPQAAHFRTYAGFTLGIQTRRKFCLSLLASPWACHHRTYTESVSLYRKLILSLYPFHDLGHIAEFEDWTNMAGWYFEWMLLLLELVAYVLAYNDTDQCRVCQSSLKKSPISVASITEKHDVLFYCFILQTNSPSLAQQFLRLCFLYQGVCWWFIF